MYKLFALLFVILTETNAEAQNVSPHAMNTYNSSILHTDAYINLYKYQHEKNIQNYNNQIELFKQSYDASLNTIQINGDMLIDSLKQANEHLNGLEVLSEFSRKCVTKYRDSIATESSTKASINSCARAAQQQFNSMLSPSLVSKNNLESYYNNNYEKGIKDCKNEFILEIQYFNYTMCVINVTKDAEEYTISNQKLFTTQMNSARCTAETYVNNALECSYLLHNRVISQIAEANTLINNCLLGEVNCSECSGKFFCRKVSYMPKGDVYYGSPTMENIFYGRTDINDCLLVKLK